MPFTILITTLAGLPGAQPGALIAAVPSTLSWSRPQDPGQRRCQTQFFICIQRMCVMGEWSRGGGVYGYDGLSGGVRPWQHPGFKQDPSMNGGPLVGGGYWW